MNVMNVMNGMNILNVLNPRPLPAGPLSRHRPHPPLKGR
ncbi:hypothetical protein Strvi_2824 [Streptomyces violaceusniger Tu 4113]|uniref:Uncharacterized protein n=1 Tax=Streptomyces violaceusniger (strain Tu 4113) TaxID=653045 RepID=G2P4B7_STRV4|nr:hypothetical protein Strvi_2824 [Streptomyces violaceusniger Tu 4113]